MERARHRLIGDQKKGRSMDYRDLRDWIDRVQDMGELCVLKNADWNLEIGAITEMVHHRPGSPAVLFDEIKGYPKGYRLLVNSLGTLARLGLTLGIERALV